MKKQYSVSITAGSEVERFLDGIGHKRGVVIEAVISQHLREHKGYLSPEAAIEAGYKFSEKDTDFAKSYRESQLGSFITEEIKPIAKKPPRRDPPKREHGTVAKPKGEKPTENISVGEGKTPEVKNKEMVLAGVSAFMT